VISLKKKMLGFSSRLKHPLMQVAAGYHLFEDWLIGSAWSVVWAILESLQLAHFMHE